MICRKIITACVEKSKKVREQKAEFVNTYRSCFIIFIICIITVITESISFQDIKALFMDENLYLADKFNM
jgi:hypothetical protein